MSLTIFGYIAAVLTTASFVPQVLMTLKTRDVSGISLGMYSMFVVGIFCWIIYGFILWSWPMIIANIITFALSLMVLIMKIVHEPKRKV